MIIDAVIVSVYYSDYLSVCLPWNRHHFRRVVVATSHRDRETGEVAVQNDAELLITDAFYEDGFPFNKYKALEQGLKSFQSEWKKNDWIAIMDADVMWPKAELVDSEYEVGKLYSPRRRMYEGDMRAVPGESRWNLYPWHPLHMHPRWESHISGYTQLFHSTDPALGQPPWHRLDLPTAQGGDTYFSEKWREGDRVRPQWECLHLGPPRVNWAGRKSVRADVSLGS